MKGKTRNKRIHLLDWRRTTSLKNVSLKFRSTWKDLKASSLSLIISAENLTIFSLSKSIQLFSLRLQKGHHLEGEASTLSDVQPEKTRCVIERVLSRDWNLWNQNFHHRTDKTFAESFALSIVNFHRKYKILRLIIYLYSY